MTLQSSGQITLNNINTELFRPSNTQIDLNDTNVRNLTRKPAGQIAASDAYGKKWQCDFSFVKEGTFLFGSNNYNLGNQYVGWASPTRQSLIFLSQNAWPTGYFNQTMTPTPVYNNSFRLANGTFLDSFYSLFADRDRTMLSDYNSTYFDNITITHSPFAAGRYWLFSIDNLLNKNLPYFKAQTTVNNYNVTVPSGGVLTVMLYGTGAPSATLTTADMTKAGSTVPIYFRNFSMWYYRNLTSLNVVKTLTWANGSTDQSIIAYVWR